MNILIPVESNLHQLANSAEKPISLYNYLEKYMDKIRSSIHLNNVYVRCEPTSSQVFNKLWLKLEIKNIEDKEAFIELLTTQPKIHDAALVMCNEVIEDFMDMPLNIPNIPFVLTENNEIYVNVKEAKNNSISIVPLKVEKLTDLVEILVNL